jgi:hypothetical protein
MTDARGPRQLMSIQDLLQEKLELKRSCIPLIPSEGSTAYHELKISITYRTRVRPANSVARWQVMIPQTFGYRGGHLLLTAIYLPWVTDQDQQAIFLRFVDRCPTP